MNNPEIIQDYNKFMQGLGTVDEIFIFTHAAGKL